MVDNTHRLHQFQRYRLVVEVYPRGSVSVHAMEQELLQEISMQPWVTCLRNGDHMVRFIISPLFDEDEIISWIRSQVGPGECLVKDFRFQKVR